MEERKIKELNYKVQMINVKLMSDSRSGDAAYTDIIKKINQEKVSIPIRGDRHMILRTLFNNVVEVNGRNWDVLYGSISTYTVIDGKDWINLENMEVESVDLPRNTFPNLKESDFFFVPGAHRMAFVMKSGFSANAVEKFLNEAVAQVIEEGEDFLVTKEQDESDFEQIFQADIVKKLEIDVSYSNQDTGDEAMEFMDEQMKTAHMKRLKIEGTPDNTGNIDVNVRILKGAIGLAQHYGKVTASIIKDGVSSKIVTDWHPKTLAIRCKETLLRKNIVTQVVNLFRNNGNG